MISISVDRQLFVLPLQLAAECFCKAHCGRSYHAFLTRLRGKRWGSQPLGALFFEVRSYGLDAAQKSRPLNKKVRRIVLLRNGHALLAKGSQ